MPLIVYLLETHSALRASRLVELDRNEFKIPEIISHPIRYVVRNHVNLRREVCGEVCGEVCVSSRGLG